MLRACALSTLIACSCLWAAPDATAGVPAATVESAVRRLVAEHGASREAEIRRGVSQVAERWWPEDGDASAFESFCARYWLPEEADRKGAFLRIEHVLEQIDGRLHEVRREVTEPLDLDTGPVASVDRLLAELDLAAHVDDDLFRSKVAFLALLNFPIHDLGDRLRGGSDWSRETWARSRMMDRFAFRVPGDVRLAITGAFTAADQYIASYYVRMGNLLTPDGRRPFPPDLRLITHWGLRDEIKSQYSHGAPGLERQRLIRRVMERIVRQEIPERVIDSPDLLWSPETNEVRSAADPQEALPAEREPDTRYARLLEVFRANREADPYVPTAPTYPERRFEIDRQIPEAQVEALFVRVLESDEVRDAAVLIRQRLGRPLEPFDLWYDGFGTRGDLDEAGLDRLVAERYPDPAAFRSDIPRILRDLGFRPARARWVAERIAVDPARGAGHAMGAVRRGDSHHLRTHFAEGGMNYKGYNIAIHELGHNVEQVFSLDGIDRWWLSGVPNNAFTEALAFVFQQRDLELLGEPPRAPSGRGDEVLDTLWSTYEIAGVALVDARVWHWMYDHPDAGPAELREATLAIAREVWNRWYAPVFAVEDVELLAVYSHMIVYGLYLPDYPLGHIVAFQLADALRGDGFGDSFESMARLGRLTPDAWMRAAVGGSLSADPMLRAARRVLDGDPAPPGPPPPSAHRRPAPGIGVIRPTTTRSAPFRPGCRPCRPCAARILPPS